MADTIYACATARGRAGVAVTRVSGPQAAEICRALCGSVPPARRMALRRIVWEGERIDEGLVVFFPEGGSFTGEDVIEFHTHGGVTSVAALLRVLGQTGLARLAEPGEFTRRALENGLLDLTQVEGLADLIDAETELQRRQALRVLEGEASALIQDWRARLVRAAALIEATIDFVDEDVPTDVLPEVRALLSDLVVGMEKELRDGRRAERIRHGFEVADIGAPNVGKSTLFNRLAGREAAITSEVAGTTRDVIEVRMDLEGLPVILLDTAGLREGAGDRIEQEGMRRALERAEQADLRVFLGPPPELAKPRDGDLVVRAKADLEPGDGPGISGLTGEGVDELLDRIVERLSDKMPGPSLLIRERQRQALERGVAAISEVLALTAGPHLPEMIAEELRGAIRALDAVVGRVDAENLLEEIFASFCIGK